MKKILFKAHNIKGEYRNCLICNNKFWAYRYKIKIGKAKFCSRKCFNLTQKGKHNSLKTQFKKGHIPQKMEYPKGKKSFAWKDKVTYMHLHDWIRKEKGNPKQCEYCGKMGEKIGRKWNLDWANIDHKYSRILEDYISMCFPCHAKYDKSLKRICKK